MKVSFSPNITTFWLQQLPLCKYIAQISHDVLYLNINLQKCSTECDICNNFNTNEFLNIFVSKILHLNINIKNAVQSVTLVTILTYTNF